VTSVTDFDAFVSFVAVQDPGSEPVWRQLLQQMLDADDPEVAQQAAAALEAA
jgi:hypothetical protein